MKNGIRFCRPKLSKFPKVGDIVIKLKCGKTGVISEEEYKHVAKFFKMLSFLSDASNTSGNIKMTNKEYGGELVVSPEEYDKVKDKFDIVEIVGDRSKLDANGHDYVEIGGVKWATMNIGALSETDYGLYFQWGDTQGYTAEQVGSGEGQKYFGWADYKYGDGTSSPDETGMTKYNATDGLTTLEAVDDAAVANWGGSWKMPTVEEFEALGTATTSAWIYNYEGSGVNGRVCTDKTDSSKVLFFPAGGSYGGGGAHDVNGYGDYWSSSLFSDGMNNAHYVFFFNFSTNWNDNYYRNRGYPVRPVLGDSTQKGDIICHNDILNKDAIFSQEDWLRLDNTWIATGFVGINTYSEEDAEDGDFIILSKGQTFIIKSEDYNDVRDSWEYVELFGFLDNYFTTVARESGIIRLTIYSRADTSYLTSISYSKNDSEWITFNNSDEREEDELIEVSVVEGDRIRWKGIADHLGDEGDNGCTFTSTCEFDAEGNIMSLLYGDGFIGKISFGECEFVFENLFCDAPNNDYPCYIVNAKNLILPATNLTSLCYYSMFYNCTSLTEAPELPATTLAEYCYSNMFSGCTSLVEAPELPATTLAINCYMNMFQDCTSLNSIKCLATDISATGCTDSWVMNVATSGTFTKDSSMTSWTTGVSGIPEGWTVQEVEHDYSKDYLTTEALESGTISFNIYSSMGTDYITSISYSTDNGETWITTNNTNDKAENLQITVNVNANDKILWKGNAHKLGYNSNYGSFFSSTCNFNAEGNVMSMLYGDNFIGENTIEEDYAFCSLFYDYGGGQSCSVVDASNMVLSTTILTNYCYQKMFRSCTSLTHAPELSATTLAQNCYSSMFSGCTSLTTAPELPATTLAQNCYSGMFMNCTSLTTAPELPATTLANYCYFQMFRGCTSLTTVPELPATALTNQCYDNMFSHCTSLTTAPELPATALVDYCYNGMFSDCTSLVESPELPATKLADFCYREMFSGCTSLTTAPELPATTLKGSCYSSMFMNCTSLTTAPELPATTLTSGCYSYMFQGCTSLTIAPELPAITLTSSCYNSIFNGCTNLNSIICLATNISAYYCTKNWVKNIAANGTFTKAASMSDWTTDNNGIPANWTVQDAT